MNLSLMSKKAAAVGEARARLTTRLIALPWTLMLVDVFVEFTPPSKRDVLPRTIGVITVDLAGGISRRAAVSLDSNAWSAT